MLYILQKKERADQPSIKDLRKKTQRAKRFGKKELNAILHDLAYDPPGYEISLVDTVNGKFYFL